MTDFSSTRTYATLLELSSTYQAQSLSSFFQQDKNRATNYSIQAAGLQLDFSKTHIDDKILTLLTELCNDCDLKQTQTDLLTGKAINTTEQRAVRHVDLRKPAADCDADILAARNKLFTLSKKFRAGQLQGFSGKTINTIVNIGIGGSHLGPQLVCHALSAADSEFKSYFLANIDPANCTDIIKNIELDTTLFIIASKTFTTQETLCNAMAARELLLSAGCLEAELNKHFCAVTANPEKAQAFGIASEQIFEFWDFVGGRYSLWSSIGLPISLMLGTEQFEQLLDGAHAMDEHFATAPFAQNMPVVLALVSIWYQNFFGFRSHAVVPYSNRLQDFVPYLQQLDMESNGKSVDKNGQAVTFQTGVPVWGGVGSNSQHAFHQWLHQGTDKALVDFILPLQAETEVGEHQAILTAHCLAQAAALMSGRTATDSLQTYIPGNKPSNLISCKQLTPHSLGALIALYEHKVFVQGTLWGINSFDQFGVELGKQIAKQLLPLLTGKQQETAELDSSTIQHIEQFCNR